MKLDRSNRCPAQHDFDSCSRSSIQQVCSVDGAIAVRVEWFVPGISLEQSDQQRTSDIRISTAFKRTTGGFIEKQSQEYLVRNIGRVQDISEFPDAVVTAREGTPITVGNVAQMMKGIQVKRGDASINGEPGVIVMVSKQPGQDTVTLTQTIERAMAELRSALPKGVELDDNVFRQQRFIEASIHSVIEVMRDAAILVLVVLILFLLNMRTTIISLTLCFRAVHFDALGPERTRSRRIENSLAPLGELANSPTIDCDTTGGARARDHRQD